MEIFIKHKNAKKSYLPRARKSGFVRIRDLRVSICKDLFNAIVLKIHEDLLDSWKQVKSLKIGWIRDHELNQRTKSFETSKDLDLVNIRVLKVELTRMIRPRGLGEWTFLVVERGLWRRFDHWPLDGGTLSIHSSSEEEFNKIMKL
jgi:hypothetical protein